MRGHWLLFWLLRHVPISSAFSPVGTTLDRPYGKSIRASSSSSQLFAYETEIGCATIAFASSHIAMSAIRNDLIDRIGDAAYQLNWVNTGWKLPDVWPGDEAGQEIFPTKEIAGRQLYRILYTIVSFSTLGTGFAYYLNALAEEPLTMLPNDEDVALNYVIASLASGISLASLVNPSPLSLVPVYEPGNNTNVDRRSASIRRNDSKKLQAYGLTRITRHPLILPVVPWGFATAMIMGGHVRDYLLFGVLSLYAIAGCAAQDLRVIREEGSVGTVFTPEQSSLQEFFQQTSFIPFQAVLQSRQSMDDILQEVPWWALVVGTAVGYQIQESFISFLVGNVGRTL
ncbi:hypothetical protein FisN_2Hh100 [Fistulifera solaris]|uniref:NnrU domain-containing protein n=1 Tax=Fistulifera solaris TaxID=1519565 RepID=A0A1Z5KPQ1_FISSO|nr:hypothetical protein FisN_2Hh100 [Fistulifera solaris]|eukprot:GAX28082.1 hypothetical protein FisN_2Hh100 [Fistulifera solaris]